MVIGVPKNVAYSNFPIVMRSSTTHNPTAGFTVSATISKDCGEFASTTNSVVGVANGLYKIDFEQAELNANIVALYLTASGAEPRLILIVTSS
jgi:hypothetical protein